MRLRNLRVGGLAVLAVSVLVASCGPDEPAQRRWYPNGGPPRNEDWHSPVGMLMKYDANHDGTLTRAELEQGLKAEFDAADKNHNGCLDSDEVRVINERRTSSDESAASPLIDWTNKGCVDFDEYAAAARSLFEQLDRDGDGKLTPDELKQKKRHPPPSGQSPDEAPAGGGGGPY